MNFLVPRATPIYPPRANPDSFRIAYFFTQTRTLFRFVLFLYIKRWERDQPLFGYVSFIIEACVIHDSRYAVNRLSPRGSPPFWTLQWHPFQIIVWFLEISYGGKKCLFFIGFSLRSIHATEILQINVVKYRVQHFLRKLGIVKNYKTTGGS